MNVLTEMINDDCISRRDAIDALWKALYEYEGKTEKQFQESDELDIDDWILHRIFVQNMSDIDRQTILNLPSVEPKRIKARWELAENQRPEDMENDNYLFVCSNCGSTDLHSNRVPVSYCWNCGAEMLREVTE